MDMNRITYPDSLDAIEVKVIYHMLIQRLLNNQHQMLVQIFKSSESTAIPCSFKNF